MRVSVFLSVLLVLSPLPCMGQDRKAEQSIRHRQAAFALMSTYFGRLLQTVEGDWPYDPAQVLADARTIEILARLPWEGFAPGTERGNTKAREEIWLDEEAFRKLSGELERKTARLSKVAENRNLDQLKAAFADTRNTCNACHKEFRKR